jgi:hypothetical protein
VLFKLGHLPDHEFVEQGHGEGRLAMALAPYHAFVDQLLSHGSDSSGLDAKDGSNVSGLVRA